MVRLKSLAATLAGVCALFGPASALSVQRNPLTYVSVVDEPTINAPSHRVNALSKFDLTFYLHKGQQKIRLTCEPNHDVIAEGATISYIGADGEARSHEPIDRAQHRIFKGHAWIEDELGGWTNVGWARVNVAQDGQRPLFEGAFRIYGDHHHIQTRTHYMQTKHAYDPVLDWTGDEYLVVWRDSDVDQTYRPELRRGVQESPACLSDNLEFNVQPGHPVYTGVEKRESGLMGSILTRSLWSRQIDGTTSGNSAGVNLTSTIGDSDGCPTTRKVALVGVATDCTYTASFNSTETARSNVITQINTASVQFEDSFNITLGLQNLTISDANCPASAQASAPWNVACSDSVTISDRLNLFSAWRGDRDDNNAYWSLLSTCATDSAVGLAWLGQACVMDATTSSSSSGNETTSGANVIVRTSSEWEVIAHETGHTFGAVHDCVESTCSDGTTVAAQQCCPYSTTTCDSGGQFIMNPSTGDNISKFSPCTIGNICSAIGRNSVNTTCLSANRDVTTITGSECGNGIVESGEDCDCGGASGCGDNSCCDPTTCKYTTHSVCDPSNDDCCSSTCQFASNGTVCRASTGQCDPQEVCTGASSVCPADVTAPDGTSCGTSGQGLKCASGQCTSRDLQCKTIMGSYTEGNDTTSCSSSGCQISCASPEFGTGVCYSMQQNFLDGTPCEGGGTCNNGDCKGSSVGKEISEWIDNNKTLVIALSVVIGTLLIGAILSCIWARYRNKGRRVRKVPVGAAAAPHRRRRPRRPRQPQPDMAQMGPDWQPPPFPPPAYQQEYGHARPGVRYA